MKLDDADIIEEEVLEAEIRRLRQKPRLGKAGVQFGKTLAEFKQRYEVVDDPPVDKGEVTQQTNQTGGGE